MKRKIFSILFALVLVLSMSLVTAVPAVVSADGTPTIDGTLSPGEWDSYFWFTDNSEGPGTGYDDDDVPIFTGYLTFDDENLYLAFDVEDDTPNTNRDFLYVTIDMPPAGEFNDPIDALFWGSIPANASFFGEAYLTGDPFPWDRSQGGSTWGTDGSVITARTITDTNRYYELKIPLAAIGAEIGDTIGLKIQARGGQYTSETDPQVVNYYPDMPGGITPIRADTRVEVEGNFYHLTLAPPDTTPPVVSNVAANPNPVAVSNSITLIATVDDTATGGSNIASAEYTLDNGSSWTAMDAQDEAFDEVNENVTASFNAPAEPGVYELCVLGTDASQNTSEPECILLVVYDPSGGFVTGGGWIDSPPGAYYGPYKYENQALGQWTWSNFADIFDLTKGDLTLSYTIDMSNIAAGWAVTEVGLRQVGAPNIDPNLLGGWMQSNYIFGTSNPNSLNDNDMHLLSKHGWLHQYYDAEDADTLVTPYWSNANYGFWFDRDGVDQWQADMWGMINGDTYNTDGVYEVVITYHAIDNTTATMFATINGVQQGLYIGGWKDAQPEFYPAGRSFTGDMTQMQVFFGRGGGGGTVTLSNIQVVGPGPLSGKATFGFVAKYKKGASVPDGQTQFIFQTAGLNFHSDSYEWLVIAGETARFKGWGTVNGEDGYRFMLWAGDGDQDTFRIKIWTEENGVENVLYDNGSHQPIGGGNIVVHKVKK